MASKYFRIPKLPVGIDCTLSILHVCIRDREWTPKIRNAELPVTYENDLCLMYSTTVMRVLNHISNIGHTKQTSLFQIAKQLNIPEWIVNLRHDTAHGYEIPSLDVLRIAVNILLAWLHDQYWAVEAKRMEEYLIAIESMKYQKAEEVQDFDDLVELWTSVSLYIHVGYHLVSNVPDPQLKETLQDLRSYAISLLEEDSGNMESDNDNYIDAASNDIINDKKYTLETARIVLLSEISRYLSKKSIPDKKDIVCNTLLNSEVFLPSKDMLSIFTQSESIENKLEKDVLPLEMLMFWKDIIFLLCEKDIMEALIIKLLVLIKNEEVNKERKLLASLWISSITYSFLKLDNAHNIARDLEYQLEQMNKRLPPKVFELKVKEETDRTYPHLKCVLWFNLSYMILPCLINMKFVSKLILEVNEFSLKFIVPILELIHIKIGNENKQLLLDLMSFYTMVPLDKNDTNFPEYEQIFTLNDLKDNEYLLDIYEEQSKEVDKISQFSPDQETRNIWNLAVATHNWAECPIGVLPWQKDTLEFMEPLDNFVVQKCDTVGCEIIPGSINRKRLKMDGQINWDNVLRQKKRLKRKQERRKTDIIMNKALETVKKRK
ncbi:uncharacterized protein LOC132916334 isoform X2 [Bombus pascuorum]|uniref:uncharacterized protein LOC132916334 isoform X2 n=1 Tax=Bombus pascuorum TaxID=65598 RepID=UPI00298EC285|nr:uncharacterized protein LOC132916334 isoform X2 [Bombus pascuorum]